MIENVGEWDIGQERENDAGEVPWYLMPFFWVGQATFWVLENIGVDLNSRRFARWVQSAWGAVQLGLVVSAILAVFWRGIA